MHRNTGVNRVFLTGYIEEDANLISEEKQTDNFFFSVITTEIHFKHEIQVEHIESHRISMPYYIAKTDIHRFIKGTLISIEGKIYTYSFIDDENIRRYKVEILATKFQWLAI